MSSYLKHASRRSAVGSIGIFATIFAVTLMAGCQGPNGRYDDHRPLSLRPEPPAPNAASAPDWNQDAAEPPDVAAASAMTGQSYAIIYEVDGAEGSEIKTMRLPYRGGETVLDAASHLNGLSGLSGKSIFIERATANPGQAETLTVDWEAITRQGETKTNYQVLPNDRIYVVKTKKKFDLKTVIDTPGRWVRGTWDKLTPEKEDAESQEIRDFMRTHRRVNGRFRPEEYRDSRTSRQ